MSAPSYVTSYTPRRWQVHELDMLAEQPQLVSGDRGFQICNSASKLAAEIGEAADRFYPDLELEAAGLSPRAGCQLTTLAADWNGHPAGTLTLLSFEKIRDSKLVYAVETAG